MSRKLWGRCSSRSFLCILPSPKYPVLTWETPKFSDRLLGYLGLTNTPNVTWASICLLLWSGFHVSLSFLNTLLNTRWGPWNSTGTAESAEFSPGAVAHPKAQVSDVSGHSTDLVLPWEALPWCFLHRYQTPNKVSRALFYPNNSGKCYNTWDGTQDQTDL